MSAGSVGSGGSGTRHRPSDAPARRPRWSRVRWGERARRALLASAHAPAGAGV